MQGLLVVLDGEGVVTTTPGDPPGCVHLGAHRVGGDHRPVQVEGVEQDRQEMRRRHLPLAGAAHGLSDAPR